MITRIVPVPEHLSAARLDDLVDRLEARGIEVSVTRETLLLTGPTFEETCAFEILLWEVEHELNGPHDPEGALHRTVLAEVAAALPFMPEHVRAALIHEMRLWRPQGERAAADPEKVSR